MPCFSTKLREGVRKVTMISTDLCIRHPITCLNNNDVRYNVQHPGHGAKRGVVCQIDLVILLYYELLETLLI